MKAYALLGKRPKVAPPPDGQRGLFDPPEPAGSGWLDGEPQ
jgi:hypothetical protein